MSSKSFPERPSIPAKVLLQAALNVVQFPYSQICKHSVAADLLAILEEHGFPVDEDFKEAAHHVVFAHDEEAIGVLKKLLEKAQ